MSVGATINQDILNVLNFLAAQSYEEQSDNFRTCVKRDHPFLCLYSQILNLEKTRAMDFYPKLVSFGTFLNGNFKRGFKCPICYRLFTVSSAQYEAKHMRRCKSNCYDYNKRDFHCTLSLDGKHYLCHFGCKIKAKSKTEINEHFWYNHTDQELATWSMNRKVLDVAYKNQIREMVAPTKDEKDGKQFKVVRHFLRS